MRGDIDAQINSLNTLLQVTQTYALVSSKQVNKIRDTVIKNRDYTKSVYDIFQQVVASYSAQITELVRHNKKNAEEALTFLPHNGKTVFVLVSANTGLFGSIIDNTFSYMIKNLKNSGAEVTVIGRLGRAMLQSVAPNAPFTYFDYPDYGENNENFSKIVSHLVQYDEIIVFYAQFQSMIKQDPVKFQIASQTPLAQPADKSQNKQYIFEPSLVDILKFFESEIFTSVLDQVMRESQLAKSASRVVAMDRSTKNIQEELKKSRMVQNRLRHLRENKKQLNTLISRKAIQ